MTGCDFQVVVIVKYEFRVSSSWPEGLGLWMNGISGGLLLGDILVQAYRGSPGLRLSDSDLADSDLAGSLTLYQAASNTSPWQRILS